MTSFKLRVGQQQPSGANRRSCSSSIKTLVWRIPPAARADSQSLSRSKEQDFCLLSRAPLFCLCLLSASSIALHTSVVVRNSFAWLGPSDCLIGRRRVYFRYGLAHCLFCLRYVRSAICAKLIWNGNQYKRSWSRDRISLRYCPLGIKPFLYCLEHTLSSSTHQALFHSYRKGWPFRWMS